ncbi:hypothetical protein LA374_00385 [Aeromonas schubertii]|uniref:Uncharacterized protein n=1 Tax=Aeromonas schubertii TaxID=652 RepID=A0ABS7V5M4_9GAMM|nr:hypothetical protein [Aeromonas schubertii]MBZ6064675.1 hypothetical protein [Aeromonas schubertii]
MSDMKCEQCGRYRLPDPAAFKTGDKVTFKRVIQRARTTQLINVDGTIVEAGVESVSIRVRGGDRFQVKRTGITMQGQPGPLTYELFGICRCAGGQS